MARPSKSTKFYGSERRRIIKREVIHIKRAFSPRTPLPTAAALAVETPGVELLGGRS